MCNFQDCYRHFRQCRIPLVTQVLLKKLKLTWNWQNTNRLDKTNLFIELHGRFVSKRCIVLHETKLFQTHLVKNGCFISTEHFWHYSDIKLSWDNKEVPRTLFLSSPRCCDDKVALFAMDQNFCCWKKIAMETRTWILFLAFPKYIDHI